ncbi:MAG: right-handed parallel beta-helix repeat-containing protein [Planctomycetota bacterium]
MLQRFQGLGLLVLLLLAPRLPGQCGTIVQGSVAGRWTAADSPICVRGPLVVDKDLGSGTLTIEAGVQVLVSAGVEIRVTGALIVQGTPRARVVFERADPAPWGGLQFEPTSSASLLDHGVIRGVNRPAVRLVNATPTFQHCRFEQNFGTSNGGAVHALIGVGDLVMRDCVFEANRARGLGGAIYARLGRGRLVMERCVIQDNDAESPVAVAPAGGGGIYASGGSLVLDQCEIVDNRCFAAAVGLPYSFPVPRAFAFGGGVWSEGTSVTMTDCLVAGNACISASDMDTGLCESKGGGLRFADGDARLTRCIVRDNCCDARDSRIGGALYFLGMAHAMGSGMAVEGSAVQVRLDNCLVSGNVIDARSLYGWTACYGIGVMCEAGVWLDVRNSTIARNRSPNPVFGAGLMVHRGVTAWLTNSIVFDQRTPYSPGGFGTAFHVGYSSTSPSSVFARYSNVEGGWPGPGNLDTEVLFRGPAVSTACGALELAPHSPCIDAGTPGLADEDIAFPPSEGGVRNDMGFTGGPLAAGWSRWARRALTLHVTPARATCPISEWDAITSGGAMTQPVGIFLESVLGATLNPPVLIAPFGRFCAAGRSEIDLPFGRSACAVSGWTFRSYALDAAGGLVWSDPVVW